MKLGHGLLRAALAAAIVTLLVPLELAEAASLSGSKSSLHRQNSAARQHDYSYLRNRDDVYRFVRAGYLVKVSSTGDYDLDGVSFPYARPEVRLFLERLGGQYRSACGERLVVTSLTRPQSRQPRNASPLSVHPTGMAMDLRVSKRSSCRSWVESTLLSLERSGVLEATREHRPPHYHVAIFPKPYQRYVARLDGGASRTFGGRTYRVGRGDTLWDIAQRFGTSVAVLKQANNLRSGMIKPGQSLRIP
ncbi:MAG TPA: DUF5715 family protein [Thermoanaerobaculia bacterium]|nr:DUF5715 family protein [Thermoanaerobaculia bacterium]